MSRDYGDETTGVRPQPRWLPDVRGADHQPSPHKIEVLTHDDVKHEIEVVFGVRQWGGLLGAMVFRCATGFSDGKVRVEGVRSFTRDEIISGRLERDT